MPAKHIRTTLALFLSSGAAAQAQPLMQVSCSWSEVIAGTTTPVSNPNSILDPGEGALITLNLYATINGSNAIGQTLAYTPPPPPGIGTVRGIGIFSYDLKGTGGDASGTWSNRAVSGVFDFTDIGIIHDNGASIIDLSGVQFPFPGATISATNPITPAWRGVWSPSNFYPRVIHFAFSPSTVIPANQQNAIDLEFGFDPNTGGPRYITAYISTGFGPGIDIQVSGQEVHPSNGNPYPAVGGCYVNCDHSTAPPILNANDFQCYLTAFASGSPWANCDNSTASPTLNANDFQCFLTKFAAGCG